MELQPTLPLVSIITPSYNGMPYIKATIESVINQNYFNIEHIIMDGGSTDGTIELLKTYPDINWVSEKDNGQSDALNQGFRKAKGEIIGWLNADDTYEPGAIHTAVKYLLENEEADMVGSDINIIDEKDEKVGVTFAKPLNLIELLDYNMVKQPTVFMRRNVIDKLKGVDEQLHYVMDWEFWLRASLVGFEFHCLERVILANFRLVKGTKSYNQPSNFHIEWQNVLTKVFEDSSLKNLPQSMKVKLLRSNMSKFYFQKMLESIGPGKKIELLRYFLKAIKFNKKILINRGAWEYFFNGICSIKQDKLSKFKKNKSISLNHV